MKEYLFSYGTLQQRDMQVKLFGRILEGIPDVLSGYKTARVEITDEVFLAKGGEKSQYTLLHTRDDRDSIRGTVFEITEKELLLTDRYEPINYKRVRVMLDSGKNAWIYMIIDTA